MLRTIPAYTVVNMFLLEDKFNSVLSHSATEVKQPINVISRLLVILLAIAGFLLALNLLGYAFKMMTAGTAQQILEVTANPFISLFIGLLITAIIQSSSTTTSMVVAAVAAGSLSMAHAVPMVMGANIGTTLTSTLIALGFIAKKKKFRKALAAGTLHDIFNILTTVILLPLELYYGLLSRIASFIVSFLAIAATSAPNESVSHGFLKSLGLVEWVAETSGSLWILLILSVLLLIASIKVLANAIYKLFIGNFKENLVQLFFSSPLKSFAFGTLLTATVQSSSVTTPLVVPLVANGKISLRKSLPYLMGANIGTTITAIISALFHSDLALSIALVHLLFNLFGVLFFFPVKFLRKIPLSLAHGLGHLTSRNRLIGFLYILLTFFLIPFLLIYFSR